MLALVSGPTCSGRSTFIRSGGLASLLGSGDFRTELHVEQFKPSRRRGDAALSFNLFDPYLAGLPIRPRRFGRVKDADDEVEVVVLVTPKTELLERLQWGAHGPPSGWAVTPPVGDAGDRSSAPDSLGEVRELMATVEFLDLEAVYRAWLHQVRRAELKLRLVRSSRGSFEPMEMDELSETLHAEITATRTSWTRQQIIDVLDTQRLGYHRIDLPYGLYTSGSPRHEVASLTLGDDLTGQSVLDVGSAFGSVSFEAERRNAASVVGAELAGWRLRGARTLGEILESDVHFVRRDYIGDPSDEEFDVVVVLNVLHHTADPVDALGRVARLARRRFILEIPTVEDPVWYGKYQRGEKKYDSFIFDQASLRAALDELGFESVALHSSWLDGRVIAVCDRVGASRGQAPSLRGVMGAWDRRKGRRRSSERDGLQRGVTEGA